MGEINLKPRRDIALEDLGGVVDPQLTVRRGRAVEDLQGTFQFQPEAARERERLRVDLAKRDGEVVVDQLGANTGADRAAVVNGRPHCFKHRPDGVELGFLGTDHEEALAGIRVTGEPPDRGIDAVHLRTGKGCGTAIGDLGINGAHFHDGGTGRSVCDQTVGSQDDALHFDVRR